MQTNQAIPIKEMLHDLQRLEALIITAKGKYKIIDRAKKLQEMIYGLIDGNESKIIRESDCCYCDDYIGDFIVRKYREMICRECGCEISKKHLSGYICPDCYNKVQMRRYYGRMNNG